VLATLQLLVSESGSGKMCLQSPTKNRQTIRSENISCDTTILNTNNWWHYTHRHTHIEDLWRQDQRLSIQ